MLQQQQTTTQGERWYALKYSDFLAIWRTEPDGYRLLELLLARKQQLQRSQSPDPPHDRASSNQNREPITSNPQTRGYLQNPQGYRNPALHVSPLRTVNGKKERKAQASNKRRRLLFRFTKMKTTTRRTERWRSRSQCRSTYYETRHGT